MKTMVNFKSSAFPKYPNEDDEIVNSNRWGKRLAEFIRDGLPRFGVETSDILCEDWGWLVNTKNDAFPVWIGCGPVDDFEGDDANPDGDPAEGLVVEFAVFVTAGPGFLQRIFKRVDPKPVLERTSSALRGLLESSPEITDIIWSDDAC